MIVVEPRVERVGPDHPDVAVSLNNRAVLYWLVAEIDRPPSGAAGLTSNNDPARELAVFVGGGDIHGPWH